jgi:hypothetical protein
MPLRQITEYDHHAGGQHLREDGVDVKTLYQYLEQDIIQRKVEQANHEVAEQLRLPPHIGIVEDNVFGHEEPNGKGDAE